MDPATGPGDEQYCPACDRSFPPGTERCPSDGTLLVRIAARQDALIGRELGGRYTLKAQLGAGGMGTVYRAWQHSVGREVAIKVIHTARNTDALTCKRFLREAKLTSRLSHPNTVAVLDFGQEGDGLLYLVMELVQGRTLDQVLKSESPFSIERMVRIGTQICDALEPAHRLSIIHRDLKPSNIMVLDDPPGRDLIKVLDFGLAKSLAGEDSMTTGSDAIVGTPSYFPPEMASANARPDARSDLYSLGVILYRMVAGRLPFEARDAHTMVMMHLRSPPAPLPDSVPKVVANLILRLLQKDPAARYQSAAQVREALFAVGEIGSASASMPSAVRRAKVMRGDRLASIALFVILLAGSMLAGIYHFAAPPGSAGMPDLLQAVSRDTADMAAAIPDASVPDLQEPSADAGAVAHDLRRHRRDGGRKHPKPAPPSDMRVAPPFVHPDMKPTKIPILPPLDPNPIEPATPAPRPRGSR